MTTKPSPNAIGHDGGPCLVAPDMRVRVYLRNGAILQDCADGFRWRWYECNPGRDILFYEPLDAERTCTCHPDDGPPVPCAEKYALSECRDAPAVKADEYQPRSRGRLIEILRAQGENPRSWQAEAAAMLSSPPAPMPVVDVEALERRHDGIERFNASHLVGTAKTAHEDRGALLTALRSAREEIERLKGISSAAHEALRAAESALTPPSSAEEK